MAVVGFCIGAVTPLVPRTTLFDAGTLDFGARF